MAFALPASAAAGDPLVIQAEKITIAPTLDGKISSGEWGTPIFSGDPTKSRDKIYYSDATNTALIPTNIKMYLRWDDTNLYFAAVVTETSHWNDHTGFDCWKADSIQVDICVSDKNQAARWRTNTAVSTKNGLT